VALRPPSSVPPLLFAVAVIAAVGTYPRGVVAQGKPKHQPPIITPQKCVPGDPGCQGPTHSVLVTPQGSPVSWQPLTTGHTAVFTVKNTGNASEGYGFVCSTTGPVTCTSLDKTSATLAAGASTTVTATYGVGYPGSGVLKLTATGFIGHDVGNGTYNVTVVHTVAVTPDGGTAPTRAPNAAGYSEAFTVQNIGSASDTYTFTCAGATDVICTGTTPASLALAPNAAGSVTASYYTGPVGTGTLTLIALGTNQAGDTGSFSVPVVAAGVAVTPDSGSTAARIASTGPFTETFTIQNTGAGQKTFTVGCSGSSNVTCSGTSASSVALAAGASTTVTATYSVGVVGAGTLTLSAMASDASDLGSYRIGVVSSSQQAPAVAVDPVNAGSVSARELCFTISLGQNAASECGDLRIVHALPTTRSMNKARTPTLLYNSQFAHPYPLVAALVTLPTTAIPDFIEAVLKVNGTTRRTVRWGGAQWVAGTTRQIVVGYDAIGDPTGIYPYTLEVASIYGATRLAPPTPASGQLVVVNRQGSPFGAGWWLAGLEQLNLGTMVWVGGDGSVRQYQQVAGTTDKWFAPSVDHPDTLKQVVNGGVTNYVRYLGHGVEVWFNTLGQHVYTYNRQRHQTTFTYDLSTGVLTAITLPTAFTVRTYQFAYTPTAPYRLTTVTAPDLIGFGTIVRRVTITQSGGFIAQIQDPDGKFVQFAPLASVPELIQSRTDRRGTQVAFSYDALGGRKISGSTLNMGSGQPIVETISPQQSLGLGTQSVDPTNAFTLIDGPRTDSADVTKVWQDRWGQPALIQDAHGSITHVLRSDVRWPAVVTEVDHPNAWRVTMTYDGRGNAASTTDYGFGGYPTTTYQWDQKWDALTKVKRPEGDSIVMVYDQLTGNRLYQQDGRGDSTRVNFVYNAANQLIKVIAPRTPAESLSYDDNPNLGNLASITTPLRFDTHYTGDRAGRIIQIDTRLDTLVHSPPSCGCWMYQTTRTYYDIMDRDSIQIAMGPQIDITTYPETVFVQKFYNAGGQLDSLRRWSDPDAAHVDTIPARWYYDAVGRDTLEVAPDSHQEKRTYDFAGNLIADSTRNAHVINMVYDALNRLVQRTLPEVDYPSHATNFNISLPVAIGAYPAYTIPAETHTFSYDALGHLLAAENPDAKVHRTYFPDGLLATDSLLIQTVNHDDWTKHVYGLANTYDRDGRRVALTIPQQLTASGAIGGAISSVYAPQLGLLQTMYDPQGSRYDFAYDALGELTSIAFSGLYTESFHYDADGRLVADTLYNQGGTNPPRIQFNPIRKDSLAYDARGLLLLATNPTHYQDTLITKYTGLGHLMHSQLIEHGQLVGSTDFGLVNSPARYTVVESYAYDALANVSQGFLIDSVWNTPGTFTGIGGEGSIAYTYQNHPNTGRLLQKAWVGGAQTYTYDSAGNTVFMANVASPGEERASYFAADGTLRAVNHRSAENTQADTHKWQSYDFEDYRYDALGRRVWVRAQKWCNDVAFTVTQVNECHTSLVRRTIWDGNQELAEIQMPWGLQSGLTSWSINTTPTWWDNDVTPVSVGTIAAANTSVGPADPNPYFGHVIYTAGRGIDQPVAVTRVNYSMALDLIQRTPYSHVQAPFSIVPFWDERGTAVVGAFSDGSQILCNPPGSQTGCVGIVWPFNWSAYNQQRGMSGPGPAYDKRDFWHGTLLENKQDKSGLSYARNRYYDPLTGRFTQEDPLGLAGGLNLYGFAGGDPVNFSDPFGLCIWDGCIAEFVAATTAAFAGIRALANLVTGHPVGENVLHDANLGLAMSTGIAPVGAPAARVIGALDAARGAEAAAAAGEPGAYSSVRVASEAEANTAARIWTGLGAKEITQNRAGQAMGEVVGRVSADATRVARFAAPKVNGTVAANLENRIFDSNMHVVVQP
jgi:RHS repeat-associated protein